MRHGILFSVLMLSSCATGANITRVSDQVTNEPILIPMPALQQPSVSQNRLRVVEDPLQVSHSANPSLRPFQRIEKANNAAKIEPGLENYRNAVQVYPYSKGALYQLYAAPGQVSLISLQKGEDLVSVSAGDTSRWMVGDTVSGTGAASQVNIMVKPLSSGLQTNLVVTTTKRTYLLELRSFQRTYMAAVSWRYPVEQAIRQYGEEGASQLIEPHFKMLDPDDLRFRYRLTGPDTAWRPVRVFDDAQKTYIEFPKSISASETPPLFVIGDSGTPELVNYRVRGQFYIVDRLFQTAELRLGEKKQTIIRIKRVEVENGD